MGKTLIKANVVITARSHNPTIVSKAWIVEKEIMKEPIINFIHTPAFSMVEGNDFTIQADSSRLQISAKKVESDIVNKLPAVVESYVRSLPETPYTAIGFNFSYRVITEKSLRNLFSPDMEKFERAFSKEYKIGSMIRFNFENFIVTLNLIPEEQILIANFNFHFDIKREGREIIENLKFYRDAVKKAEGILEVLFDGGNS